LDTFALVLPADFFLSLMAVPPVPKTRPIRQLGGAPGCVRGYPTEMA